MSERNLAKNTAFYSAALALQKVLSFVFFIILARSLGVEGQGRFTFALSFVSLFAIFLDLGLSQVLIRETARDKKKAEQYLANIMGFKLLGALLLYLIIVAAVNLMGYPAQTRELVYVAALVMMTDSLTLGIYGAIRGWQNLGYESVGTIVNQLIVLIVGGGLLLLQVSPVIVMGAYLAASVANLGWGAYHLAAKFKVKLKLALDWQTIKILLAWSLPFAVAGIFSRIFSSADIVLLSQLSGDRAVGIYSAAFKVAFALQFAALAFSASLYPAFSTYWSHSRQELPKLFTKSLFWLMFLAGPIVFGVIAIADPAIPLVFGAAYAESVLPLQILMASMLFVFLCFPIGALLNACDRQKIHTVNLGITALVSVILNLMLIPLFSYNGAAISNLVSYIVLFVLGLYFSGQVTKYDKRFLLWSGVKILLACSAMFIAAVIAKNELNFVWAIIIGGAVFGLSAYGLKLFSVSAAKEFVFGLKRRAPMSQEVISKQ